MKCLVTLSLLGVALLAVPHSAIAGVQIWNLSKNDIYYARGFMKDGLWWSDGWKTVRPRESATVSANDYLRIEGESGDSLNPGGASGTGSFWRHPVDYFTVQESPSNQSEVYLRGTRVTTATLKNKGFSYVTFSRYTDGKILKIGSYWSVGSKTINFSHSTSGDKSENFSYLSNKILDFSYSISCARKDKGGTSWSITNDRLKVHREGPILEASTFTSPAKPCYSGTVTLYYAYR